MNRGLIARLSFFTLWSELKNRLKAAEWNQSGVSRTEECLWAEQPIGRIPELIWALGPPMCFSRKGFSELARPTEKRTHNPARLWQPAATQISMRHHQIEVTIRRLGLGCSLALNEWNTHVWWIQPTPGSLHCIVGMHCVALWSSVSAVESFYDGWILMPPLRGVIPERRGQTGNTHAHKHTHTGVRQRARTQTQAGLLTLGGPCNDRHPLVKVGQISHEGRQIPTSHAQPC